MNKWTVKSKKLIDSEPQYEKGMLAWDGKPFDITLSSENSSKETAKAFAKQVKLYDLNDVWKVWIECGSVIEEINLTDDEKLGRKYLNVKKKKEEKNE